ncbi:Exportin 7, partial [Podila epigama]
FATSRLKTLVEDHFSSFTTAEQQGLRTFVLRQLYQNPDAQPFIITAQAQLFALISKLGWIEHEEFRALVDNINVFLQQGSTAHRIVGIRILNAVTTEMNLTSTRHATRYRKIAINFRDSQLLPIFQCALSTLQALLQSQLSESDNQLNAQVYKPILTTHLSTGLLADPDTEKLKESILVLMRSCLNFDFIGTMPDESSDDVGSIQVMSTWRSVFEEPGYQDVLWGCWKKFSNPLSALVLECLSQAASIRRSLFSSDDARNTYIHSFMRETILAFKTGVGQSKLQDVSNYHEFCRMLSRFRSTFQFSEICEFKEFEQWITLVGDFTSRGFHAWKMVSAISSAKQGHAEYIHNITVNLSRAYMKSRLDCVQAVLDGDVDDPLESEEEVVTALEMFATISRAKYTDSGRFILAEFKDLTKKYHELIQRLSNMINGSPTHNTNSVKDQIVIAEMQLTWMVYIIGACIGGRISYQSTGDQEQMDGELASEVLGFIHQTQMWVAQRPSYLASPEAHLYVQSAILYFYTQFRSSYIGEEPTKSTKVYGVLGERWGFNTPNQVLDVIMNSSLGNLRSSGDPDWRKHEEQLVVRTLKLFTQLALGSVKHIRKLDTMQALMKNHDSSDFRFLASSQKSSDTAVGRSRMTYYTMLSRVLFAEDNMEADFFAFVKPWEDTLDRVTLAFEGTSDLSEEEIRLILLGMFKDLRGFVSSITNRKQYALFFDWFYPAYTPIVQRAIEIWPHDDLGIAILRFWNEFASNKNSRVTFDISSPNGILLFRETSSILYTYGQNLLNRPLSNPEKRWAEKYVVESTSLSGKYVNFGVFKLYGDKALERILDIFFQLMLAIPVEDMVAFPKLSMAYFSVMDVFTSDHMTGLPMMPHPVLAYMFHALGEIIQPQNPDTLCCTLACSAIDKICTFVLNWMIKDKIRKDGEKKDLSHSGGSPLLNSPGSGTSSQRSSVELLRGGLSSSGSTGDRPVSKRRQQQQQEQQSTHWLVEYLMLNREILSYLFLILFQVVVFENRSNYWSLSRPLLGLILLNREYFVEYTNSFIQAQLSDRQEKVQDAVNALMEGVDMTLTTSNRDRFTQNITTFRRECAQLTLMSTSLETGGML